MIKPKAKKNPVGRPLTYDKNFHPIDFVHQSKQGKNITQIAASWDVCRETIWDWGQKHAEFSNSLKKGRQFCEAWYTNLGMSAMVGQAKIDGKPIQFNLGAFVWMTKNVLKWTDKVETNVEHSGSIRSGTEREQSLKKMFKDEKAQALALELSEHLCEQEELAQKVKDEKNNGEN